MISTAEAHRYLTHRNGCGRPQVVTERQATGRVITRCRTCSAGLWHDTYVRREDRAPSPSAPSLTSPWRCRSHLEPVTWKGTGCTACADEQRARAKQREKERPAEEDTPYGPTPTPGRTNR